MPRNNSNPAKKQSKEQLRSEPQEKRKKKGTSGDGSDDDSIDSRGNIKDLIAYSESEAELSDYESEPDSGGELQTRPPQRTAAKVALKNIREKFLADESPIPKRNVVIIPKRQQRLNSVIESDSEEEDDEYDEENEMEEEYPMVPPPQGFSISFGIPAAEDMNYMIPKRHNMKNAPQIIKKFVELITKAPEENTIDDQIDRFKTLSDKQQKHFIESLERCYTIDNAKKGDDIMFRILSLKTTPEIQSMILAKYNAIQALDPSSSEYYKNRNWIEKAISLPLGEYKDLPVTLEDGQEKCSAFMKQASTCLNNAIYGQDEAKLHILQFIAAKITNPDSRGKILLLIGKPGTGKSALIKNGIASALGWPFQFISLGGDSDASTYNGHQLVYEGSHCGKIANSLAAAKSLSMVLMFDEVDKISTTPKGEEVQNLLIHLTDPVQNDLFEDKYLSGIPIDLSKIMFVFSANDITKIDPVLLDRCTIVNVHAYVANDKCIIAEQYLWPEALKEVHLGEKVLLPKNVLEHIIAVYCKGESGVRELRRCCKQIAEKINMLRMFNTKELPFHIPNFKLPFTLKEEHISLFLKIREDSDKPPAGMYV